MAKRSPNPTAIREPPALLRQPISFLTSGALGTGEHWRQLVGRAPVVRSCIQTLVMQITGLDWYLSGDDKHAVAYFTKMLESADEGEGWETMVSRVVNDMLVLPFGGATEIGPFPDGVVAWISHLDAATMVPTYDRRFPYAQVDPWGGITRPVSFRPDQVGRVRWQAQTDLRSYGWTITPAADSLPAIQGLLRADRFWQGFLMDTPPAGILDVMDMSEEEARDWYESWRTMLAGVDPFKVPILYGGGAERKHPATWIAFQRDPNVVMPKDLIKGYAEYVTACFGMTLGDLGLFGQELRLAGAIKLLDSTKRQGLAKVKRGVKTMIDMDVLPDGIEFMWAEVDLEDDLRRSQSNYNRVRSLREMKDADIIDAQEARAVAVHEGLLPEDIIDPDAVPGSEEDLGETPEEEVDVTDAELGPESEPTGESTQSDLEGRAEAPPRAFPQNSPWARKMATLAQRILGPAKRGITVKRLETLLDLAASAYGEGRSSLPHSRTADDAREALEKALQKADWWKSPDLADDVSSILRGAYAEGLEEVVQEIEAARIELGLAAAKIGASFNVTNETVIGLIEERAGAFIRHIDDGTRHYIMEAIVRGVRRGIGSPQIAKSILISDIKRDLIETFRGRALSIVNTEINWAESSAALHQQVTLGLSKKRWVAIPSIACPICKGNHDRGSVPADFEFDSVFGATQTTPGHPGKCHCYITFDKAELRSLGDKPSYWFGD